MTGEATLMHRWFEQVWNLQRQDAIDEMMAEDCIAHGLLDERGSEPRGPAAFKDWETGKAARGTDQRNLLATLPDLGVEVLDTLTEGDRMAARCRVTGTAASGKRVDFTGMSIIRIANGKIAEGWNNYDFHVMEQQLS